MELGMSGYRHRALGTLLDDLRKGLVGGLIRLLSEWPQVACSGSVLTGRGTRAQGELP
jgi:hypothetical protein